MENSLVETPLKYSNHGMGECPKCKKVSRWKSCFTYEIGMWVLGGRCDCGETFGKKVIELLPDAPNLKIGV